MKKIFLLTLLFIAIAHLVDAQMNIKNSTPFKIRVRIKNGVPCASVCESTPNPGIGVVVGAYNGISGIIPCSATALDMNSAVQVWNPVAMAWVSMPAVISPMVGCGYPISTAVLVNGTWVIAQIVVAGGTSTVYVHL